ncbi:MAG: hypothetical protein GY856_10850, partial [bacterium]|nr:hypothetical protein [bacterium]
TLRQWSEAMRGAGGSDGELEAGMAKLCSLTAELLDAHYDPPSFEERKRFLREQLALPGPESYPSPVLIRGLKKMKLGELRKIEANLERFCRHIEEAP